eukprot:s2116_g10.t1
MKLLGDSGSFLSSVDASRAVVHKFCGQVIPGRAPVRSGSFLGKRVILTSPGTGLWNVVNVDNGGPGVYDYDLGMPMCAFVIQEFTWDVEVDSHEVTLDKSTKKKLLEAIDRTAPDQEG